MPKFLGLDPTRLPAGQPLRAGLKRKIRYQRSAHHLRKSHRDLLAAGHDQVSAPTLDAARAFPTQIGGSNERRRSVPLSLDLGTPVDRSVDKVGLKRPHTVYPSMH